MIKKFFISFLLCVLAGACSKKPQEEKVGGVVLYGYMSSDPTRAFHIRDAVILKTESGYIKVRTPSGAVLEHSGRYSVVER